jgi:hypothetical protein
MDVIQKAVAAEFAAQKAGEDSEMDMKMGDEEDEDEYDEDEYDEDEYDEDDMEDDEDDEDGMKKMKMGDKKKEDDDEEIIDLDELLYEVESQFKSKSKKPMKKESSHYNEMRSENDKLKKQLSETKRAINVYKKAITESKLFASKSNALSKIFAKSNLSENQKRKIADKFDNCKTEGEVRIAYNVLKENLQSSFVKAKPSASRIIGSTKTVLKESSNGIISDSLKARMQELAGIKKSI